MVQFVGILGPSQKRYIRNFNKHASVNRSRLATRGSTRIAQAVIINEFPLNSIISGIRNLSIAGGHPPLELGIFFARVAKKWVSSSFLKNSHSHRVVNVAIRAMIEHKNQDTGNLYTALEVEEFSKSEIH